MNKLMLLALTMTFCYAEPGQSEAGEYVENLGFVIQNVEYDGHMWMIVEHNCYGGFEFLHHPDCEKCYLEFEEFNTRLDDMFSCVHHTKGSSTYVVDNAGCVNF